MPFTYQVDPAQQLARLQLSGNITGATFVSGLRALVNDPAWQPGFSRVWDYGGVTKFVLSPAEVEQLRVVLRGDRYRSRRTAMVVHRQEEYEAAQLFRAKVRAWPIQVFWSMADAMAWLESE